MRSQGMAKNKAQSVYSSMLMSGELAKVMEHDTNRAIVGTPAELIKLTEGAVPGTYRM
jgi:hypothetical protein